MKRKDLNFRGLSRPAADAKCFMHGNLQDSDHWWYAVATYGKRNGGIPGMNQAEKEVSSQVELLVALPPRNANAILSGVSRSLPVLPRVESPRVCCLCRRCPCQHCQNSLL